MFGNLFHQMKESFQSWRGNDARAIEQEEPIEITDPAPSDIDLKSNGRQVLDANTFRSVKNFEKLSRSSSVQKLLEYADSFSASMNSLRIPERQDNARAYLSKMAQVNAQVFEVMRSMESVLVSSAQDLMGKGKKYAELAGLCGSEAMKLRNQMEYVNKIQENVFHAIDGGDFSAVPYGETYADILKDFNYTHIFTDSDQLDKKKLGSGCMNTVYTVQDEDRASERVLKNGSAFMQNEGDFQTNYERMMRGAADLAEKSGKSVEVNSGHRDVAVSMIDKLFGFHAVVDTSMAFNTGGGQASLMDKAAGASGNESFTYMGSVGGTRAMLLKQLEMNEFFLARGLEDKLPEDEAKKQASAEKQQLINLNSVSMVESAYNLAALDLIVGHVDRHAGNIMLTEQGMKGIDNDASFGLRTLDEMEEGNRQIGEGKDWKDVDTFSGVTRVGVKGEAQNTQAAHLFLNSAFPQVPVAFREKILAIQPSAVAQTLRGLLNQPEIDACVSRVIALQNYMKSIVGSDREVNSFAEVNREKYASYRANTTSNAIHGGGEGNYISALLNTRGMRSIQNEESVSIPSMAVKIFQPYLKRVYGISASGNQISNQLYITLEEMAQESGVINIGDMIRDNSLNVLTETIMAQLRQTTEDPFTYLACCEGLEIPMTIDEAKTYIAARVKRKETAKKAESDSAAKEGTAEVNDPAQEAQEAAVATKKPVKKYVATGLMKDRDLWNLAQEVCKNQEFPETIVQLFQAVSRCNRILKSLQIPEVDASQTDEKQLKKTFFASFAPAYANAIEQLQSLQDTVVSSATALAAKGAEYKSLTGYCGTAAIKLADQISALQNMQIRLMERVEGGDLQGIPQGVSFFEILDNPEFEKITGIAAQDELADEKKLGEGCVNSVYSITDEERGTKRVLKNGEFAWDMSDNIKGGLGAKMVGQTKEQIGSILEMRTADRDAAASMVDKLFGFHAIVDTTMMVSKEGKKSSVMDFAEGAEQKNSFFYTEGGREESELSAALQAVFAKYTAQGKKKSKEEMAKDIAKAKREYRAVNLDSTQLIETSFNMAAFDIIVGFWDRNNRNIMLSDNGAIGIDNDLTFSLHEGPGVISEDATGEDWLNSDAYSYKKEDGSKVEFKREGIAANFFNTAFPMVPKAFREKILSVSEDTLAASLSGFLGKPQIEAAKRRLHSLQEYISKAPVVDSFEDIDKKQYGRSYKTAHAPSINANIRIFGNYYSVFYSGEEKGVDSMASQANNNCTAMRVLQLTGGYNFSGDTRQKLAPFLHEEILQLLKTQPEIDLVDVLTSDDSPLLKEMMATVLSQHLDLLPEEEKELAYKILKEANIPSMAAEKVDEIQSASENPEKTQEIVSEIAESVDTAAEPQLQEEKAILSSIKQEQEGDSGSEVKEATSVSEETVAEEKEDSSQTKEVTKEDVIEQVHQIQEEQNIPTVESTKSAEPSVSTAQSNQDVHEAVETAEVPQTGHIDELRSFKAEMTSKKKGIFSHKDTEQFQAVMYSIERLLKHFDKPFTNEPDKNSAMLKEASSYYDLLRADCEVYLAKKGGKKTESGRNRRKRIQNIYRMALSDREEIMDSISSLPNIPAQQQTQLNWTDILKKARTTTISTDLSRTDNLAKANGKSEKYAGRFIEEGVFVPETHGQALTEERRKNSLAWTAEEKVNSELTGLSLAESAEQRDAMRTKNRNVSERNVATSRVAEMLGVGDIICKSKTVEVQDVSTGQMVRGNLMEYAKGRDAKKIQKETREQLSKLQSLQDREQAVKASLSPNVQKQLTSLQVLDYICGQTDRHAGNYFMAADDQGVFQSISGIDNDNAFGLGVDMKKHLKGTLSFCNNVRPVVSPEGELTIPHMDKQFAENILSVNDDEMRFVLKDLIEDDTTEAAIQRLHLVQAGIRKELENQDSTRLVDEGGWGDQTHMDLMQGNNALKSRYIEGLMAQASGKSADEVQAIMFSKEEIDGIGKNMDTLFYDVHASDTYYADLVATMMGAKYEGQASELPSFA